MNFLKNKKRWAIWSLYTLFGALLGFFLAFTCKKMTEAEVSYFHVIMYTGMTGFLSGITTTLLLYWKKKTCDRHEMSFREIAKDDKYMWLIFSVLGIFMGVLISGAILKSLVIANLSKTAIKGMLIFGGCLGAFIFLVISMILSFVDQEV